MSAPRPIRPVTLVEAVFTLHLECEHTVERREVFDPTDPLPLPRRVRCAVCGKKKARVELAERLAPPTRGADAAPGWLGLHVKAGGLSGIVVAADYGAPPREIRLWVDLDGLEPPGNRRFWYARDVVVVPNVEPPTPTSPTPTPEPLPNPWCGLKVTRLGDGEHPPRALVIGGDDTTLRVRWCDTGDKTDLAIEQARLAATPELVGRRVRYRWADPLNPDNYGEVVGVTTPYATVQRAFGRCDWSAADLLPVFPVAKT